MAKQDDQTRPDEGAVLKTGGEDSASAYVASAVPAGTDCPTVEIDRVKIVPPSQTPTVKLADLAKRPGPRAPDQMVKPKPKGPVELPEGRPVTKMQVIEIDPDFLVELALERRANEARETAEDAGAGAEEAVAQEPALGQMESPWVREAAAPVPVGAVPSADGPPSAPVSTAAGKRPGKGALALAVVIGVTLAVGVIAALRPGRGRAVDPIPAVSPSATATVMASTAATATPSATAAPPPSTASSAAVTPSATLPQASRPPGKQLRDAGDPYGAAATPIPPRTAAEPPPPAPAASPPPAPPTVAPVHSAAPSPSGEPTIKPVF